MWKIYQTKHHQNRLVTHGLDNQHIAVHHNTAKFLVACTPNGAISYISPVYVSSISDVQLTQCSGFLETLKEYQSWQIGDLLSKIC